MDSACIRHCGITGSANNICFNLVRFSSESDKFVSLTPWYFAFHLHKILAVFYVVALAWSRNSDIETNVRQSTTRRFRVRRTHIYSLDCHATYEIRNQFGTLNVYQISKNAYRYLYFCKITVCILLSNTVSSIHKCMSCARNK